VGEETWSSHPFAAVSGRDSWSSCAGEDGVPDRSPRYEPATRRDARHDCPIVYEFQPHAGAYALAALRGAAAHDAEVRRAIFAKFAGSQRDGSRDADREGNRVAYAFIRAGAAAARAITDLLIRQQTTSDRLREASRRWEFSERLTSGGRGWRAASDSFERSNRFGVSHYYEVHLEIAKTAAGRRAMTYDGCARNVSRAAIGAPRARAVEGDRALLRAFIGRPVIQQIALDGLIRRCTPSRIG